MCISFSFTGQMNGVATLDGWGNIMNRRTSWQRHGTHWRRGGTFIIAVHCAFVSPFFSLVWIGPAGSDGQTDARASCATTREDAQEENWRRVWQLSFYFMFPLLRSANRAGNLTLPLNHHYITGHMPPPPPPPSLFLLLLWDALRAYRPEGELDTFLLLLLQQL